MLTHFDFKTNCQIKNIKNLPLCSQKVVNFEYCQELLFYNKKYLAYALHM